MEGALVEHGQVHRVGCIRTLFVPQHQRACLVAHANMQRAVR
jgi:hypothetical protein